MPLYAANSFKAMNKHGECFRYLRLMFPRITDAKIKDGTSVVHRSDDFINDKQFEYYAFGTI